MRRRAFLLIAALQLAILLLVLGGAMIYSSGARYRNSRSLEAAAQAGELAHMGVEDALVKLRRDGQFPPPGGDFTYQQRVENLGFYQVAVNPRWSGAPYFVMEISAEGEVAGSRRFCRCLVDLSPTVRGTADPNPNLYRVLDWQEGGREFGRASGW